MSSKIGNDLNPFENVWSDEVKQKETITEVDGKKTIITVKENRADFSKIIISKKDTNETK